MQQQSNRQRGALLVLVAFGLFAIVAMGAFAIDSALLYTARTQLQLTANTAALAALEAYFATPDGAGAPAAKLAPKMASAVARASQVTEKSVSVQLVAKLFSDSSKSQSDYVTSYTNAEQQGDVGTVTPGRYYNSEPNSGCNDYCTNHPAECTAVDSCPCGGGGTIADHSPCFDPSADTERANSVRVELKTNPQSKIQLFLGRIFGHETATVSARATATLVPRRAVFLIDMSRSVTADSHPFTLAQRDTYALFKHQEAALTCAGVEPEGDDRPAWSTTFTDSLGDVRRQLERTDYQTFDQMSTDRPAVIAQYDCMTVPNTGDEGNSALWETQVYLTDQARTPQPLQSILQGIHVALKKFQQRAVKGDMVAVVGFDDAILPSRATLSEPYTGLGDTYTVGLVRPDSQEFENMLRGVDVAYTGNAGRPLSERLGYKFMMPRLRGEISPGGQRFGAGTDLAGALAAARGIIMTGRTWPNNTFAASDIDPEYERADNFVMLFTDGQGTCYRPSDHKNPRCITSGAAADVDNAFNASLTDAYEELATLKTAKITSYISLTGNVVAPNTVLRKDGNKCMTQERHSELYAQACAGAFGNIANVAGKNYFCWWWYTEYAWGSTPSLPHATYKSGSPNGLYNAVVGNGAYLPLRPPCPWAGAVPSLAACESGALEAALDARCSAATVTNKWPVPNVAIGGSTYTNADGALFCDPRCRSKTKQVEDYISQIMSQNPFVLVE